MKIVVEHLLKADIGLICLWPEPNHITSCPNKIYEYMISGLPVIASNYPSMEGLINNNKCGVCVDPMDPKEIAKAVEYFIEHPDEARKMGENGRKAVLNKYNWENDSKKLLQIYEEL